MPDKKPKEYRLIPGRKEGLMQDPTKLIVLSFAVLILAGLTDGRNRSINNSNARIRYT